MFYGNSGGGAPGGCYLLGIAGIIIIILLPLAIVFGLIQGVGVSITDASASAQATANAIAFAQTPTPKPGEIVCQADWSSGLNGWTGSSDWSTSNGQLVNDGTNSEDQNSPTLQSPCDLSHTANFRLVAQIQMQSQGDDAGFGFYVQYKKADSADSQEGYALGNTTNYGRCSAICTFSIAPASAFHAPIKSVSFLPGNGVRTYDIEVKDNTLTAIVDGVFVTQIKEDNPSNGGTVGFWNKHTQIIVNSFEVIAM